MTGANSLNMRPLWGGGYPFQGKKKFCCFNGYALPT